MRRPAGESDLGLDLATRTKARIEHPHHGEPGERAGLVPEIFGLPAPRPAPIEAEPRQIVEDCGGIFLAAAGPVDILDAQQEAPSVPPRRAPAFERRTDVTEMQITGGARRK